MALLPPLRLFMLTTLFGLVFAVDSDDLCNWEGLDSAYGKSYTPWFRGWKNVTSGPGGSDEAYVKNMACWWYADCIFSLAPETAKQQYAAISIVMALIPLILKDIAWPHRRIVMSLKKGHWVVEILIRALGLNPVITGDRTEIKEGKKFSRWASRLLLVLLVGFLLLAYGMLIVMEFYSKRSSLGCPVPAFVVLWFVVALAPAGVEVAFSRIRDRMRRSSPKPKGDSEDSESGNKEALNGGEQHSTTIVVSESIPGGEQHWIVQFCWGLYYSAGGLIFTSIMLVSVVELFTWMLLAAVATAASKLLGYKLCGFWGTGLK
ncbi:hypothetical protein V493_00516 [Pseudogymnoascus sp. VKM F-4281 (FW-2241)]|nr:hypothetical protein V493_00516 [Pseudogymnoascus sp. VKM F-4281 (FW-2241)]